MKFRTIILFIFLGVLLIGCASRKELITTQYVIETSEDTLTDSITKDTIRIIETITLGLSRQERKAIKDSIKHVERMYEKESSRIRDSLSFENKESKIEIRKLKNSNKFLSDSLSKSIKRHKLENKAVKDSLAADHKKTKLYIEELKLENKAMSRQLKHLEREKKQEVKKYKKRSLWWVWIIVGITILSILINLFFFFFRR